MADIGKIPGTEMEVFSKYPDSYRLDHPNFRDVSKATFAKGVITAFYAANTDVPLVIEDKCDVKVDGEEFKGIPIFYHCPKAYAEHWKQNTAQAEHWGKAGSLNKDTGSIGCGVYSFSVGDEVAVMLQAGVPIAIIGFADGTPRRPSDYIKVDIPEQAMQTDNGVESYINGPYHYVVQISNMERIGEDNQKGPDGFELKLLKEAKIFPDKVDHVSDSGTTDFSIDWDYYCLYAGYDLKQYTAFPMQFGDPAHYNPPADPNFGPMLGYLNYGTLWSVDIPNWAAYWEKWLESCDTIQRQFYGDGGWENLPYAGLWPASSDGQSSLGRPVYLILTASDGHAQGYEEYVMRNFLIEVGPRLYIIRLLYLRIVNNSTYNLYLWKNRIAWPYNTPPPQGWSGYPPGDYSGWTAPIWPGSPNPYPTTVGACVPPPDETFVDATNRESFYSDNPHWVYAAPSSKEILDGIDGIVEKSNSGVNVHAAQQGWYWVPETVFPPEGFKEESSWYFNDAGNLRKITFKTVKKPGDL